MRNPLIFISSLLTFTVAQQVAPSSQNLRRVPSLPGSSDTSLLAESSDDGVAAYCSANSSYSWESGYREFVYNAIVASDSPFEEGPCVFTEEPTQTDNICAVLIPPGSVVQTVVTVTYPSNSDSNSAAHRARVEQVIISSNSCPLGSGSPSLSAEKVVGIIVGLLALAGLAWALKECCGCDCNCNCNTKTTAVTSGVSAAARRNNIFNNNNDTSLGGVRALQQPFRQSFGSNSEYDGASIVGQPLAQRGVDEARDGRSDSIGSLNPFAGGFNRPPCGSPR